MITPAAQSPFSRQPRMADLVSSVAPIRAQSTNKPIAQIPNKAPQKDLTAPREFVLSSQDLVGQFDGICKEKRRFVPAPAEKMNGKANGARVSDGGDFSKVRLRSRFVQYF